MSDPQTTSAAPANPHYLRFGGRPAVERLVDAFYRAMDTRTDATTIRAMHAADLGEMRRVLVNYLCEWLGGPREYSAERGAPMLRRRHLPFRIDSSARDAWLSCMRQALDETCSDAAFRDELAAAFAKVADFMRNTEDGSVARSHPVRPGEAAPGEPAAPRTSPTRRSPS